MTEKTFSAKKVTTVQTWNLNKIWTLFVFAVRTNKSWKQCNKKCPMTNHPPERKKTVGDHLYFISKPFLGIYNCLWGRKSCRKPIIHMWHTTPSLFLNCHLAVGLGFVIWRKTDIGQGGVLRDSDRCDSHCYKWVSLFTWNQ